MLRSRHRDQRDQSRSVLSARLAAIALEDFPAAAADLEHVVDADPKYDYHRAAGLLAHALGKTGQTDRAAALFDDVTQVSTLSETQYNYACFLAAQGRPADARQWAARLLAKKLTMPSYLRRRERPWFRKAKALLKKLPQVVTMPPRRDRARVNLGFDVLSPFKYFPCQRQAPDHAVDDVLGLAQAVTLARIAQQHRLHADLLQGDEHLLRFLDRHVLIQLAVDEHRRRLDARDVGER